MPITRHPTTPKYNGGLFAHTGITNKLAADIMGVRQQPKMGTAPKLLTGPRPAVGRITGYDAGGGIYLVTIDMGACTCDGTATLAMPEGLQATDKVVRALNFAENGKNTHDLPLGRPVFGVLWPSKADKICMFIDAVETGPCQPSS